MREKIGVPVTIRVPQEIVTEVHRIAKKRKMAKAETYRILLEVGLSMHQDMEKVGIISAVDFLYYCRQALKIQNDKVAKDKQLPLPI